MPDEADTEHRWSAARWIGLSLVLLLALLVLYVLSPGPVLAIAMRLEPSDPFRMVRALEAFYWPLGEAIERSETVEQFFDWYLGLWGVR